MINSNKFLFRLLSDGQIQQIHEATLRVLEKTGVIMDHPRALEILSGIGCKVFNKNRVCFPPHIVEDAIKKAPKTITIYSREGEPKMVLGNRKVYYGTVTSLPFISDINGERRKYTLRDCKEMTIIMDSLDTLEFGTGTGMSSDIPAAVSDVHEISCMLENSPKPVLITTHDEKGLKAIIDICSVYKGDIDAFISQPFIIYCICPISPLKYTTDVLGKLMMAVENGFPFFSLPVPGAGATSPVSVAGTLVCGNAEALSGLVLAQTIRPGAPVLYGGFFTIMDMSSMIMTHGSPEFNLLNVAQAELAQHYHLPSFSSAGCTDSQEVDEQAAFECGFSIFAAALGGANLVHAISVLGSGMAVSKELLVLCDELITYTRRFMKGIEVTEQLMAVEEIEQIGPGGNFLQSDLTLNLFRKEHWFPKCFVRSQFENWVKGGKKSLKERLAQKCKDILINHIPSPVKEDKLREIKKIIECSDKERL